eukprot:TRINITY_DN4628_c0_g2_i1.p1 TRINITY_DN4628_c0_g2~~TRINITY_DN4628_c0_g2_i1.p1  ORF type:complete len:374 (+),score=55.83 TRINITY_DN4628_c0_g2_i1:80-1201(+)
MTTQEKIEPSPVVQCDDISTKYDVDDEDVLGVGGFARVVAGSVRETGKPVAIKVFERENLKGKKYSMMCHEREILRFSKHRNIIKLYECVETATHVHMVLDRMQTDLYEHIKANQTLTESDTSKIIKSVLEGVSYLHDNCIVHRDIKPENILLNGVDDVCLADFGVAKILEAYTVNATPIGTSYYMAPEVIRGIQLQGLKPRNTTREEVKFIDVWSTGVVCYISLSGVPPFYGAVKTQEDRTMLLKKIDRGVLFPNSRWITVSENAKDFISELLSVDASDRPTARKCLKHPFLKPGQSTEVVPGQVLTTSEVKEHLSSLIATCDTELDPAPEPVSQTVAPENAARPAPIPKPSNPMKLRRSRPKLAQDPASVQ